MKLLLNTVLILCMISLTTSSCKKNEHEWDIYLVPHSLFFLVKESGNRLSDSMLNNCKLSYFKNGNKLYIDHFERGINDGPFLAQDLGVICYRKYSYYKF